MKHWGFWPIIAGSNNDPMLTFTFFTARSNFVSGDNVFVSFIEEIVFKLATNKQRRIGFLLTMKLCTQGLFCPCPGSIYRYKTFKYIPGPRSQVRLSGPFVL